MLRLGNAIRLTPREIDHLTHLTEFKPEGVKSLADLDVYIERCKQYYWGKSRESKQFHQLLDDVVADMCGTD